MDAALAQFQASQKEHEALRSQLQPALDRLDRDEGLEVDRDGLKALREGIKHGTR